MWVLSDSVTLRISNMRPLRWASNISMIPSGASLTALMRVFAAMILQTVVCTAGVVLSISPSTQTASVGSHISMDLVVSGGGNGKAFGTYDITLSFDPSVLLYYGVAFGNQLNLSNLNDVRTQVVRIGGVEIFEVSLDTSASLLAQQATSFRLATVTFVVLSPKMNSNIAILSALLGDVSGDAVPFTLQGASLSALSACDAGGDGLIDVSDVQLVANEALGLIPARHDLNSDGIVNVTDMQIVVNGALGLGCSAS
jgi:Cohesin domain